jgi:hypothetical protein
MSALPLNYETLASSERRTTTALSVGQPSERHIHKENKRCIIRICLRMPEWVPDMTFTEQEQH